MIEFHADDYGLFPEQSRRILRCRDNGVLNGISIMPNSPYLEECLKLLRPHAEGMAFTVHLNLMEGKAISEPEQIPLLVNQDGVFSVSFLRLLLISFGRKRTEYLRQIKNELLLQIAALQPFLEEQHAALRLDGHAHWHMLPVVFDALMEAIKENQLPVCYIRIPSEPVGLYLRHLFHIFPFHPINLVKTALLRILARRNCRRYKREFAEMEKGIFFGVFFSGNFNYRKFCLLLPEAEKLSAQGVHVEFLAHPGAVYEELDVASLTNRNDVVFLSDTHRNDEAEALIQLKDRKYHSL